jgi:exodeoxyribonuclease X
MTGHVLRVIDFETTGMEPPAAVVEVGVCDLTQLADGSWAVGEPDWWFCGGIESMPPEVRAVHHISFEDVRHAPPFERSRVFEGAPAALVAHNMDFEAKFLGEHGLPSICTLKAAYRVWPEAPGHSNSTLRYWLEDRGLLTLDDATAMPPHRAGPDAYVTAHILAALFAAGATGKEMVQWTREPRAFPTCPIGEWRGKPWADVDAGFLRWTVGKQGMDPDTVWNARRELERRADKAA